jgi:RNA polymerase sigma-70 factor (ECF subfamily)
LNKVTTKDRISRQAVRSRQGQATRDGGLAEIGQESARHVELSTFTDAQLVLLYGHGCEPAFDELFGRHHRRLHRFLVRMTGDVGEAEDVLQETFVRVARAASKYEPTAAFTTWLFKIAVNRCSSYLKQRGRCKLLRFPGDAGRRTEAAGSARSAMEPVEPESRTPFEQVRGRELQEAFLRAVASLDEPLRAAFVLHEFEGFAGAEAAAILDVPLGTLKTHVHRARLALRRKLAGQLGAAAETAVAGSSLKGARS